MGVAIAIWVINLINGVLGVAGGLLGAFVVVDTITRRPDAFVAADRQTKTVWMAITVVSALMLIPAAFQAFISPQQLLWDAAVVACLVYLVDVRPHLRDVQRGTRW